MTNPYHQPPVPQPARPAPKWARKRYVLPALGLAFFIGIGADASDSSTTDVKNTADKARPTATVTATATVTETAEAEPAPTVTATKTIKVTKTVTAQPAAGSGSDDSGSSDVYYSNCSEARAAGAAPVYRGEPGYGSHLDRDGVGCDI